MVDLDSYNDVASRIEEFRAKYPNGCLRPVDPATAYSIEHVGDQTYLVYVAAAYREPDDPCPGIGAAWELVPGKTPYTRGSELQNAETSAWGRAIVAIGAADTRRGIASQDEVRNRAADRAAKEPTEADSLRREIRAIADTLNVEPGAIMEDFRRRTQESVATTENVEILSAYLKDLKTSGFRGENE